MIITIYAGYDDSYFILKSKNEDFQKQYGDKLIVSKWESVYKTFSNIAEWCNNKIGEECLFEVD